MASSSSSSSVTLRMKFDVFLSFRGEDTRNNFTDHLYAALVQKGFDTFKDEKMLMRGTEISSELLDAIEESWIAIVVLSKGYAESIWCLEELTKIVDCMEEKGQTVLPIFYNVDPSDVRKQTGDFKKAFDEHEEKLKGYEDLVEKWRAAFTKIGKLSGWHLQDKSETEIISDIIANISKRKYTTLSTNITRGLFGIDSKVEAIESLLCVESMDLCAIGIWGLGGIGKTTLARAVFNKIFSRFDDAYFIENIREESEKDPRLLSLKHLISSAALREETVELLDESTRLSYAKTSYYKKKLLIVFDDVTHPMQIESIIGPLYNWLNTGCKFIVTTRKKQVLQYCCSEEKIYKLNELGDNEALQLFSRYAFKKKDPPLEFEAVSKKAVEYTRGIPLALIEFGNFLYGKSKQEWESVLGLTDQILSRGPQKELKSRHDGEGGDIIKSGLDSERIIGEGAKEIFNLVELIKSDALDYQKRNILDAAERLGSGSTVVNVIERFTPFRQSDATSSSQQGNPNPVTDHEMSDISVDQGGSDEQKKAKKWTGKTKWLGKNQESSLTSQIKSSETEDLREQLTRTQQQLNSTQEQLNSTQEQLIRTQDQLIQTQDQLRSALQELAEAHRRSDEQAQMILNTNSTCQWLADLMRRHYGNDPPPPSPGSGSAMIS